MVSGGYLVPYDTMYDHLAMMHMADKYCGVLIFVIIHLDSEITKFSTNKINDIVK